MRSSIDSKAVDGARMLSGDFDPEEIHADNGVASGSESDDGDVTDDSNAGRLHYLSLTQSSIRKSRPLDLGERYHGTAVTRDTAEKFGSSDGNDDDIEDDPFKPQVTSQLRDGSAQSGRSSSGNEESYDHANEDRDGSDEDDTRLDGMEPDETLDEENGYSDGREESEIEDSGDSEDGRRSRSGQVASTKNTSDRAAFRQIAERGQAGLIEGFSLAREADVEKGKAVKSQRQAFQSLLRTRMRLQKGLVMANSTAVISEPSIRSPDDRTIIESAEKSALALLNSIGALRSELDALAQEPRGVKRKRVVGVEDSLESIQESIVSLDRLQEPGRRSTLNRWAEKTAPISSLVRVDKLRTAPAQQPMADLLDGQLISPAVDRLVARTQVPRSCAPAQVRGEGHKVESMYDDADWYALLLRDLVESKALATAGDSGDRSGALPGSLNAESLRREARTRREGVDVKASKGRKLRYVVQEKIQNFLAPDDRTTWGDRQSRDLFGSLMGGRVQGGLYEDDDDVDDAPQITDEMDVGASALRLFGSATA